MHRGIFGSIYAYNDGRHLHVYCDNQGDSPGELTHNILPDERTAKDARQGQAHDDNGRYGHGDPVPSGREGMPGSVTQRFPIGGQYQPTIYDGRGQYSQPLLTIGPELWFRTGFRGNAFHAFPIPETGEIVEIPYEEMTWYNGRRPERLPSSATDSHLPPAVQAMLANRSPQVVHGQARIVPIPDAAGGLEGWEVWFENEARGAPKAGQTHGFTGTLVLLNGQGEGAKNAGLGLESMACPAGGTSAMQFIANHGDYGVRQFGVRAAPGTPVRLGIRGHSTLDTTLPGLGEGERVLHLRDFEEAGDQRNSNWFDGELLLQKLGEKKGMVDFFRDGKRINDELVDTVYAGHEAFERAEFKDPPRVKMSWVDDSEENPGGGWQVRLQNLLPEEDDLGRVGFSAALKLLDRAEDPIGDESAIGHGGASGDPAAVPPGDFSPERREYSWFIPYRQQMGGIVAEPGQKVVVDTGALGWRGELTLPGKGEEVDSSEDVEGTWVLRESDFQRRGLYPKGEGPS